MSLDDIAVAATGVDLADGTVATMLIADKPPDAEAKAAEEKRRADADAAEDLALSSLLASDFAGLTLDTIPALEKAYNRLIRDHPTILGKRASTAGRQRMDNKASTLVYGEILFRSFAVAFEKLRNKYGLLAEPGGVFYDIGAGTGKPALAAALLHDFEKVKGVELIDELWEASNELKEVWHSKVAPRLPPAKRAIEVEFVRGDLTEVDWTDCTFGFCNSTCFDRYLMEAVARCYVIINMM